MEIFTILGLAICLFLIMVIASVLMNVAIHETIDEMYDGLGFIVVMIVLSIILSSFFTQPEKFGYEKIVSNNSVEQEVESYGL